MRARPFMWTWPLSQGQVAVPIDKIDTPEPVRRRDTFLQCWRARFEALGGDVRSLLTVVQADPMNRRVG